MQILRIYIVVLVQFIAILGSVLAIVNFFVKVMQLMIDFKHKTRDFAGLTIIFFSKVFNSSQ